MKHRLLTIHDDYTEMYCHITQFEEIDKEECKKIGICPGYTIMNFFRASYVYTVAGYDFHPEYFENRICEDNYGGTKKGLGTIIKYIKDIDALPNPLNVSCVRNLYNRIKGSKSSLGKIIDEISDYDSDDLRKVIYVSPISSINLLIMNIKSKEKIYELTTYRKIEDIVPMFLWIPIKPFKQEEIEKINISPFECTYYGLGK